MKATGIASLIASAGIGIASLAFAYQHIAPYISQESCMLEVATASGDTSAIAVQACRNRFRERGIEGDELPDWTISSIEGRARFGDSSAWATLYNGDSSYTITRIRVGITDPATSDADDPETRYYNVSVNLPPLSRKVAEIDVFETYDSVVWFIDRAWGYQE